MRRSVVSVALILFVGCAQQASDGATDAPSSRAEPSADARALHAELLVARDLLRRSPTGQVMVDSMYAAAGQAPPSATGEMRPASRTRMLIDSLNLNRTQGEAVVLRLSEPVFESDSVRISATIDFTSAARPGRRGYETVDYTLVGGGPAWTIRTRVQLGIT